jgi:hypothetical protein
VRAPPVQFPPHMRPGIHSVQNGSKQDGVVQQKPNSSFPPAPVLLFKPCPPDPSPGCKAWRLQLLQDPLHHMLREITAREGKRERFALGSCSMSGSNNQIL